MPLGSVDGVTLGARADFDDSPARIYPSQAWLGRVLERLWRSPATARARWSQGPLGYPVKAPRPAPMTARGSAASSIWACAP